jgi:predicted PurR-regulated permease PerM
VSLLPPGRPDDGVASSVPARTTWSRGSVVLLSGAAAVVVLAGVHAARDILGPVFLALVMTIIVHPLRIHLRRWLPEWLVSTICVIVVFVVVAGLVVMTVLAVARFGTMLGSYQDEFRDLVDDAVGWLNQAGISSDQIEGLASSFDLGKLSGVVTAALNDLASALSSLVFLLAVCLFMAIDASRFPERLVVAGTGRSQLVLALDGFARGTRRYLVVSTVFGLIVAVLDTIALALLDIPAPWVWGVLAFLTNYIPNIGFVIGLVPPAILALLEDGFGKMVLVIVIYSVLNLVIQSGIQPKVVGDAVGLSTTLTFVSLVFWAFIIGPIGAIMAVPLSLLVRALLVDADPASTWLVPLIANRDAEAATLDPS